MRQNPTVCPGELNAFEPEHLSVGSVRLNIIELKGGQQPIATESGDWLRLITNRI